jgi:hypothetical protein
VSNPNLEWNKIWQTIYEDKGNLFE